MITYPAKYTVVLKSLLDNEDSKQAIDKALSEYPLFIGDENSKNIIPTREELNTKLLDYYKYREIGFETVGRFIDELRITMNHIMPYYSEMYKTVQIMCDIKDPFGNVDIVETFKETRKDSSSSTSSSEGTSSTSDSGTVSGESNSKTTANDTSSANKRTDTTHKNIKSDTPQDSLTITGEDIGTVKYANEVNWDNETVQGTDTTTGNSSSNTDNTNTQTTSNTGSSESSATATATGSNNGETEHTFTKKGNQGVNTYAHDMIEFRQTVIDITEKIITDKRVAELFMLVY